MKYRQSNNMIRVKLKARAQVAHKPKDIKDLAMVWLLACMACMIALSIKCQAVSYNYDDSDQPSVSYAKEDPFEKINRPIYAFNKIVYNVALDPASKLYTHLVPVWARNRLSDGLHNINISVSAANNILQAKPNGLLQDISRLIVNTTLGFGVFNMAKYTELNNCDNQSFDNTLYHYGFNNIGSYMIVPVLGPSSTREFVGTVTDGIINPMGHANRYIKTAYGGLKTLDSYTNKRDILYSVNKNSLDGYAAMRSLYFQNRSYKYNKVN
jgi:phospholipid-binding lipoprotein MlaA